VCLDNLIGCEDKVGFYRRHGKGKHMNMSCDMELRDIFFLNHMEFEISFRVNYVHKNIKK
jgi:hypothetical protein